MIGPNEQPKHAPVPLEPVIQSAIDAIRRISEIHGLPVVVWHKGSAYPALNGLSHEQMTQLAAGAAVNTEQLAAYTLRHTNGIESRINELLLRAEGMDAKIEELSARVKTALDTAYPATPSKS